MPIAIKQETIAEELIKSKKCSKNAIFERFFGFYPQIFSVSPKNREII